MSRTPTSAVSGGFDRVLALCEAGVRGLLAAAPGLFDDAGPGGLRDPCAG